MAARQARSPGASTPPPIPFKGIRPINGFQLEEIPARVDFGSLVVDAEGVITFLSRPGAEFLGIRREDAIGRHVREVIEHNGARPPDGRAGGGAIR